MNQKELSVNGRRSQWIEGQPEPVHLFTRHFVAGVFEILIDAKHIMISESTGEPIAIRQHATMLY